MCPTTELSYIVSPLHLIVVSNITLLSPPIYIIMPKLLNYVIVAVISYLLHH